MLWFELLNLFLSFYELKQSKSKTFSWLVILALNSVVEILIYKSQALKSVMVTNLRMHYCLPILVLLQRLAGGIQAGSQRDGK